jgi:hypothetical protein
VQATAEGVQGQHGGRVAARVLNDARDTQALRSGGAPAGREASGLHGDGGGASPVGGASPQRLTAASSRRPQSAEVSEEEGGELGEVTAVASTSGRRLPGIFSFRPSPPVGPRRLLLK